MRSSAVACLAERAEDRERKSIELLRHPEILEDVPVH